MSPEKNLTAPVVSRGDYLAMIFDAMCRFVDSVDEKTKSLSFTEKAYFDPMVSNLAWILRKSALFAIGDAKTLLNAVGAGPYPTPAEEDDIYERLLFPFDCMAVEREGECVAFAVKMKDKAKAGADNIDLVTSYLAQAITNEDGVATGLAQIVGPFTFGPEPSFRKAYRAHLGSMFLAIIDIRSKKLKRLHLASRDDGKLWPIDKPEMSSTDLMRKTHDEAVYSFKDVMRFVRAAMHPKSYIVEKAPNNTALQKGQTVRRSANRKRYMIVSSKDIKRLLGDKSGQNGSTLETGHRRRACWHTLKDPRFRFKAGQRVPVKSCWVGPRTGIDGGERYEVLVDIPSMEIGGE